MLVLKIDVTKFDKSYFFEGKNGAKYADLIVFENREPDKYDNTHIVYQGIPKEERDAGKKGAIVGNGKLIGQKPSGAQPRANTKPKDEPEDW
jgi:hypothetical protein